jgi:hypothetical protein
MYFMNKCLTSSAETTSSTRQAHKPLNEECKGLFFSLSMEVSTLTTQALRKLVAGILAEVVGLAARLCVNLLFFIFCLLCLHTLGFRLEHSHTLTQVDVITIMIKYSRAKESVKTIYCP